jgi:alpha-L-fucosidase
MKRSIIFILILGATLNFSCQQKKVRLYEPTWESLNEHKAPQWFSDAKFGIFVHWGVYSVPAYHEWYLVYYSPKASFGKNLGGPPYTASQGDLSDSVFNANILKDANEYHRKNFGVDFDYDEFIPMFRAENYHPENWAKLFKKAGARYVVLTAKHGEEFAMWPSKFTPRNSMDMGPHRDLAGDLARAVRSENLKMGFYHNTTYSFYDERFPNKEWVTYMNNSIKELVDLYHPDILWGDVLVSPERNEMGEDLGAEYFNTLDLLSYFYNHSPDPSQVVANDRFELVKSANPGSKKAISNSIYRHEAEQWKLGDSLALIGDFQTPERQKVNEIFDFPWECCDALDPTSWGYNKNLPDEKYMSTDQLVDNLVDIVSKNGNLLINIGPRADGTIPEVQQERLLGIGKWLEINGEAIYETRYWEKFGEENIRFTRKGDNILYAISLVWPGETLTIKSLKFWNKARIRSIHLLGAEKSLDWELTDKGLVIRCPAEKPCDYAFAFKIEYN